MRLDEVKELVEKGLTNAAIASAVSMSIRQVQRLKRRLLEAPVKLPKTTGQLIKLLQKKAAQGDLHSIKTLLKEYKETKDNTAADPVKFNEAERQKVKALLKELVNLDDDHYEDLLKYLRTQKRSTVLLEHLRTQNSSKEGQETTSKDLHQVKTPTPPSLPSQGSTGEEDPKPSAPAVGNYGQANGLTSGGKEDVLSQHLPVENPEGREPQLSPLVKDVQQNDSKEGQEATSKDLRRPT